MSDRAIVACDWGTGCSVDAAYVDWDSPDGPWNESESMVCGAVTTSPYHHDGQTIDSVGIANNCSGSPHPWQRLSNSQTNFNQRVAEAQNNCLELGDDVCEAIQIAYSCLSAAVDLAGSQSPFPLPDAGGGSPDWTGYGGLVGSAASSWLSTSADPVIADVGHASSRAFSIIGAINTILAIDAAYSQCAP